MSVLEDGLRVGVNMGKNTLATVVLLALMTLWTLLAWGTFRLQAGLADLGHTLEDGVTQLDMQLIKGPLLLIPQDILNTWLPGLLQAGRWIVESFPVLASLLGYIVWLLWGAGMLVLMMLTVVTRRLLK